MQNTDLFLKENNIKKLLISLAIPAMFSGLIEAGYNIIDSLFVGQFLGANALGALSVISSTQIFFISLGIFFSVGTSSIMSRALGAKNTERALKTLAHGFTGALAISIIIITYMIIHLDNILIMIGATPEIFPYAKGYGEIIIWSGCFLPLTSVLFGILRACGQVVIVTKFSMLGAVINIILDALFIIVFQWGVHGAALATAIAQIIVFLLGLWHTLKIYHIKNPFSYLFPISIPLISEIIKLGIAPGTRLMLFSITTSIANKTLGMYDVNAVGAFGLILKYDTIGYILVFSFITGAQPLIGLNYGANQYARVRTALFSTLYYSVGIGVLLSSLYIWAPLELFTPFTNNTDMLHIAQYGIRLLGCLFFLWAYFAVVTDALQLMGHAKMAALLAMHYPVSLIIGIIVLPKLFGALGVWLTFPITNIILGIATTIILIYELKKLQNKEKNYARSFGG